MNHTLILVIVMAINLTFSTITDVLAKYWGITNDMKYFYLSLGTSIVTMLFYILMIKYGSLTISTPITLLLTMIISVGLGYFHFHEPVTTTQWIGISFGFVSILLMLDVFRFR